MFVVGVDAEKVAIESPQPGSPQWWAELADLAATRGWCYRQLGIAVEARMWQGVATDATAQLNKLLVAGIGG